VQTNDQVLVFDFLKFLQLLYSFSMFEDTFVYRLLGTLPNFNDMYLHNYKVLDYGLICKNNPKLGLVSVPSGPDAHLICLSCHFSCHSDLFIKYGALGCFLCQAMCCD
jgi:hypothetical protein